MADPFFSIVLPTKNRPALLRDAIKSVLFQDFDDYELIVSDNFNDEKTKVVIDEFRDNSHVRYLRTERELNIPDHWEFATKNTRGDYTLLLTDRAFLHQGALKDIFDAIKASQNPPVVFWKYGYFDEHSGILLGEKEEAGQKVFKSIDLLKDYVRTFDAHYLPRPHVGCYRLDIIREIKEDLGRLYWPFGPDFTSSLLSLAYSDRVLYLPRPLVFFQGANVSAGTKAQTSILSYLESINDPEPYKYVPIKAPINGSLIFNDFLKIQNLAKRNLKDLELDWVFYFALIYEELWEKQMLWGVGRGTQKEFWEAWARALATFDERVQEQVRRASRKRWLNIAKSYVRETFVGRILLKIKRALLHKPSCHYADALKAGGF